MTGSNVSAVIDPRSDRPIYKQLADELRRQIHAGHLAPGQPLPSEATLMSRYAVSRNTTRLAVGLLRAEGLVVTEHGRGSYVRPTPPVRRLSADRYRVEVDQVEGADAPATSFTQDHGVAWADYRLDRRFAEVAASTEVAELLEVASGTPLLERRFTFYAGDTPQQLSTSYYPLDLVAGTPIADPANEPWPGGNIAQLASIGVRVTHIQESVRARMPMPDEADTLHMPPGVPVVTITRRMFAEARPVEAAVDIVIPADRVILDYRIDLA